MDTTLKVFSLERAFSNFLIKLLLDNFQEYQEESVIAQPWKHQSPVPFDIESYCREHNDRLSTDISNRGVDIYLPLKDPYKWVISYFRGWIKGHLFTEHYEENEYDLLAQFTQDMKMGWKKLYNNPNFIKAMCEKYNQWVMSALTLTDNYKQSMILTYRQLLLDPSDVLFFIKSEFDLTLVDEYQIEENEVITGHNVIKSQYNTSYWTQKEYLDDLQQMHIDIINDEIFWSVLQSQLGIEKNESN